MATNIQNIDNRSNDNKDQKDKLRGPKNIIESQNAYLAASLRSNINDDSSDNWGTGKKLIIGLIVLTLLFVAGMLFKRMLPDSNTGLRDPEKASSVLAEKTEAKEEAKEEIKSESNESPVASSPIFSSPVFSSSNETTIPLSKTSSKTTTNPSTNPSTKLSTKLSTKAVTKETQDSKQPEALRLAANKLVAEFALDETTEDSKQPDLHETSQEKKKASSGEVDYYNRQTVKTTSDNGLQSSIDALMNTDGDKKSEYTAKLDKEADIRQNAVRSIALEKGDTLWSLAKRAYGDGLLYHKILAANPQITEENARKLRIGTLIRVPN